MKLMAMVTLTLFFISLFSVAWAVNETNSTLNQTNQTGIYESGNYSGMVYTIRDIENEVYIEEINCSTENNTNCTYNRTVNQTTTHVYLQEPRHNVSGELLDYDPFDEITERYSLHPNETNSSNTTQVLTILEEQHNMTIPEDGLIGDGITRQSFYGPGLLVLAVILAVLYVRRDGKRQKAKQVKASHSQSKQAQSSPIKFRVEKKVAESEEKPFSCSHATPESRALLLREKGYPSSFVEKKYEEWKKEEQDGRTQE